MMASISRACLSKVKGSSLGPDTCTGGHSSVVQRLLSTTLSADSVPLQALATAAPCVCSR